MFHFAWVLPMMVVVALLAIYFVPFLRRLPARTRNRLMVAATVYVGGAIGGELVEGWYVATQHYDDFVFSIMSTIEESLELAGVILLIRALLDYVESTIGEICLVVGGSPNS
jgi:hypothetical protein